MHWTDVMAQRLAQQGDEHIIATGITPSGEFHIGHLREILTGDMIARAARKAGLKAELVFVVDNADPLRKVYPFLDEAYHAFIGHQLGTIPAPDPEGKPDWERFEADGWSYGDHFLAPFLEALEQIGVKPRLLPNLKAYREGKFAHAAQRSCDHPEVVREIIERVSGRELPSDWFPWQPLDSKGSLDEVKVTGYEFPLVHWVDRHGVNGTSDITKGEGKLPWRLDWPAKWGFNRITCEPFGKDHGAAGGSYDTGKEIAVFFGHEPPLPLTYEWISLRGQGAMSSSAGNTVGPIEALQLVPPEILRFLIANSKPNKAIEFDTGMGLVTLADEYERQCMRDFDNEASNSDASRRQLVHIEDAKTAVELSSVVEGEASQAASVSFRHLAMLAQIKPNDDDLLTMLSASGHVTDITPVLHDRLKRMRSWIESDHFPDDMRISMVSVVNEEAIESLNAEQLNAVQALPHCLSEHPWTQEGITSAIKAVGMLEGVGMKNAYRACYTVFMGTDRGPRLAPILENCERDEMIKLALDAATLSKGEPSTST